MEPKYIKLFKTARNIVLSQARSIQSRSHSYFLKIHFNIILPSKYIFLAVSDTGFDAESPYTPLLWHKRDKTSVSVIVISDSHTHTHKHDNMAKHTHTVAGLAINLKQVSNKTLTHTVAGHVRNSLQLQLRCV
jgi:hypothetical protein